MDPLESAIMNTFRSGQVSFRFAPAGWWECDVICVRSDHKWEEVEIKTGMNDYRDDKHKCWWDSDGTRISKHERLSSGDTNGPNKFWFALPEDVARKAKIPSWAGLMVWRKRDDPWATYEIQIAMKAPTIHREAHGKAIAADIYRVTYQRFAWYRHGGTVQECTEGLGI